MTGSWTMPTEAWVQAGSPGVWAPFLGGRIFEIRHNITTGVTLLSIITEAELAAILRYHRDRPEDVSGDER